MTKEDFIQFILTFDTTAKGLATLISQIIYQ